MSRWSMQQQIDPSVCKDESAFKTTACGACPPQRQAARALGWSASLLLIFTSTSTAVAQMPVSRAYATEQARDANVAAGIVFPRSVPQGSLVIGKVPSGSLVRHAGRELQVTPYGSVAFGVGRDEAGPVQVEVTPVDGPAATIQISVKPRDWPVERINGVPPSTVSPPAAIAERIRREQAQVTQARKRNDARADFAQPFIWPVKGRISGRFGNQRVYNGTPKSPHSGMDIAAPAGTQVKAPAAGIVTFAEPDLYLTGGTVLIDHGHGISSNFLHLSRIDVKPGDRVEQGQVFAAVGATGRATGPHLHWGMNWFDVRIDPLLILESAD